MATVVEKSHEISVFRNQNDMTRRVMQMNAEGVTHIESLLTPQPAGNSMNWVLGHLLCVYNNALPMVGQDPVVDAAKLKLYDRGSAPLQPGDAVDFGELLQSWDEACARFDKGLSTLTPDALDEKAPFSPSNNPNETVRSLLGVLGFHQAYHVGQTGILRRVTGKPGAIR